MNDGSHDNSGEILAQYAKQDARIHIINKANEGVSKARNDALTQVTGDYVMFVDADDWMDLDACEVALSAIGDADVLMWTYMREFEGHSEPKAIFPSDCELDARQIHRRFIGLIGEELAHPEAADALCPIWGKLYRRSLLEGRSFIDLSEIGTYEDGLFNL